MKRVSLRASGAVGAFNEAHIAACAPPPTCYAEGMSIRSHCLQYAIFATLAAFGGACTSSSSGNANGTGGGSSSTSGGAFSQGGGPGGGGASSTGEPSNSGGASNTGGTANIGGVTSSGGVNGSGGASDDSGADATDGSSGCGVPNGFLWSSSNPIIGPMSDATHNLVSIKDPTVVFYNGKYHVYASVVNVDGNYNMVYLNFTDWSQAASAVQYYMDATPGLSGYHCAPQLFYFAPKNRWYLVYQSDPPTYSTTSDPSQPSTWSKPASFIPTKPTIVTDNAGSSGLGWIDFWVICDDVNCHLFFENDNGFLFRSQTSIEEFPKGFGTPVIVMQDSNPNRLFEASNVYKMKGTNQYLLIVEAIGSKGRYFRSWTADALDGTWTTLAASEDNPFAGANNVTFTGTPWTSDISHGEMIRGGYDQTMTIDTCNLQYLYQGKDPSSSVTYNLLPWQLGLLTKTN